MAGLGQNQATSLDFQNQRTSHRSLFCWKKDKKNPRQNYLLKQPNTQNNVPLENKINLGSNLPQKLVCFHASVLVAGTNNGYLQLHNSYQYWTYRTRKIYHKSKDVFDNFFRPQNTKLNTQIHTRFQRFLPTNSNHLKASKMAAN